MKMLFSSPRAVLGGLLVLSLAACAEPRTPPQGPSRAEAVLDAQYAAQGKTKPMRANEANRIYEEYLKSIGKPIDMEPNAGQ